MKKNILFCILIFLLKNIFFAQEIEWIITKDTDFIFYDEKESALIQKNVEIAPSKFTFLDIDTNQITYIYYDDMKGEIDADKVIPKNSHELFTSKLTDINITTLPYYNFDILKEKDRTLIKKKFTTLFTNLKNEDYTEQESYKYFIENNNNRQIAITNPIVRLDANNQQCINFFVNYIKKIKNGYECEGVINYTYKREYFINTPTKGSHTLLILFNGDFINVYEDSEDKLIMTYAITDEKTLNEFNNLILTGKCDLSNVTWPRHADGTSPYDNQNKPAKFDFESLYANSKTTTVSTPTQQCTNVSVNKTMSVTENLKLRSGEATTTSVLTVMSAGTKVKILELGKEDIIDGIKSNWGKVEVISGRDRDGNKLKSGMTGWCYGGYLE